MRRHLSTAALLGIMLFAAGCSANEPAAGVAPPAADVPSGPAGDAGLRSATQQICDQATRTSSDFGSTLGENAKLMAAASAQGAAEKTQVQKKITRDMNNYVSALNDMAKLTTDAKLRTALTTMGKQVAALKGDLTKVNDQRLAALHAELDKGCGRG